MKTWQSESTAPNILGTSGELHGPPSLPLANEPQYQLMTNRKPLMLMGIKLQVQK
jgi:hypothetical protein